MIKLKIITITVGNGREEKGYCLLHNDRSRQQEENDPEMFSTHFNLRCWRWWCRRVTIRDRIRSDQRCLKGRSLAKRTPSAVINLPLSSRQMLVVHRLFEVVLGKADRQRHSHLHRHSPRLEQLVVARNERRITNDVDILDQWTNCLEATSKHAKTEASIPTVKMQKKKQRHVH